jgi:hypothetical protein
MFGISKETKEYCPKLIEACAPGGCYVLAGGTAVTEAKPEKLRALMEASRECGVYR